MGWTICCLVLTIALQSTDFHRQTSKGAFWEITRGPTVRSSYVYISEGESGLKLTYLASGDEFIGRNNPDGSVTFVPATGPPTSGRGLITLRGSLSGGSLEGQMTAMGRGGEGQIEIKALRLASLWACSNHDKPNHMAKSEKEMHDSTEKNGCAGWHKVDPPK